MAGQNRRAGRIYLKIDGALQDAKGSFSYNLGYDKNDGIIGADGVHGYKSTVQVAYIEGVITDRSTLNLAALAQQDDITVTLDLANGKTIVLSEAWFAGEGTVTTEEAEITVRWESSTPAQEI
ncbi:phage tail tube protein [Desulfovibrio sp. OttesenSCG-928-C06]|nr:phage tail tube protein [Desulfovibrio sp. OttesenSCG-928-C06]